MRHFAWISFLTAVLLCIEQANAQEFTGTECIGMVTFDNGDLTRWLGFPPRTGQPIEPIEWSDSHGLFTAIWSTTGGALRGRVYSIRYAPGVWHIWFLDHNNVLLDDFGGYVANGSELEIRTGKERVGTLLLMDLNQ